MKNLIKNLAKRITLKVGFGGLLMATGIGILVAGNSILGVLLVLIGLCIVLT